MRGAGQIAAVALASITTGAAALPAPMAWRITHLDVSLTPDFAHHALSGRTRLTLRTTAAVSEVSLPAPKVSVDRAGGDATSAVVRDGHLVLSLKRPARAGSTLVLDLTWHGAPRALSWDGAAVWSGWGVCDWMICDQDRPGDKAMLDLEITAPAGFETLGPGELVGVARRGALRTWHWRESRPTSTYLFGFVAGDLRWTETGGGNRAFPVLSRRPEAEVRQAFADAPAMAAFFADKAGVPLPPYRQTLLPGDAAQEADRFALLGTDGVLPVLKDPQEDWLIAHEMAHQWWGNLLTGADWRSGLWLNEGMVTFMTAAWKEHRWGRAAYDREMALARKRWDMAKTVAGDVPLDLSGTLPDLRVRHAIAYSKGALFLDALRRDLGEDAFWAGVRGYTRGHAGGVVTSRDLEQAMERASGRDLGAIFRLWAYAQA